MKNFNTTHLLAAIAVMFFASCSTEQAVFTSTDETTTERIDMVIEGNELESIFLQDASNNNNLVDYNFYGSGSNQFDIRLNIDADRTLVIKLVNETTTDLWAHEGGYSMFATQDLADKQQFVTVELIEGSELASYKTNVGDDFPKGTYVNVFNIIDFNPANNEIFARIIDMPMMSTTDAETVNINGTFRGSINFLNL